MRPWDLERSQPLSRPWQRAAWKSTADDSIKPKVAGISDELRPDRHGAFLQSLGLLRAVRPERNLSQVVLRERTIDFSGHL
jgi:hypothetical protein